jgi:hypothetical protein
MLHPERMAILEGACGCSDCMMDSTLQPAINQLVAEWASVAPPILRPDALVMLPTFELPPDAPPVDLLAFFVAVDVIR